MTSTETRAETERDAGSLPPIEWFRDPGLTEPTPVTITADGRVYGHIACWSQDHVGMPGRNVKPPRSRTDYSYYHVGSAMVSDGGTPTEISVGRLVQGTGHAPLTSDAAGASDWYDSTGSIVATVCAGEDSAGVWFSGAVAPGLDEVSLYRLRASAVSGDWRVINNSLELTAALMVPSPGFPIPRARVASATDLVPIVAAGMVFPEPPTDAPNPQEPRMPEQDHTDASTPDAMVAAPFGKDAPTEDTPDDDSPGAPQFESGDSVLVSGTDMVVQFIGSDDGETGAIDGVPLAMLEPADEAMAASAAERFTDRQRDRVRDRDMADLKAMVASLTEKVGPMADTVEDLKSKREADERTAEAQRLIASAGLD